MKTEEALIMGPKLFFNALREGKGVQEIVDIGFELLGNPIHVIDASYKVTGYTKNVKVDDSHWCTLVNNRYLPYYMVSQRDIKEIFAQFNKSNRIFVNKPKNVDFEILHAAIIIDNKVFGYVIVPGIIKSFNENDIENAALLSDALAMDMQRKKYYQQHSRQVMYEFFLADLLEGNKMDRDVISERLKCLNWTLHENTYVLTIRKKHSDFVDELYLANLSHSISNQIYGSKAVAHNNSIVLVINRSKKFPNENETLYLTEFLKKNELYGGISRCFHAMEDLAKYFKQSIRAIDLGEKLNRQKFLFAYDDYSVSDLMSICSAQRDMKDFCHPSVFLLIEHDCRCSDQLTSSLNAYLLNNKNLEKTANALGIHRNTMRLRFQKIQGIINLDLNDDNIFFHLLLSFKILRFIEETNLEQQYLQ